MPVLETLTLASIAVGALAILRFIWYDSQRFSEILADSELADESRVSPGTARRLALQAAATRVRSETENLPRAA